MISATGLVRGGIASLLVGVFVWLAPAVQAQDAIDPAERTRIESIVRDYLLQNPEIILEAIQALEAREEAAVEAQRRHTIAQLVPTLTASPLTPVLGAEDGDVVMVEFFDNQCGYCKRLFPPVRNAMANDLGLKVVFVEYPILGPASPIASRAVLASNAQGKYFDFHGALMEFQGRLTDEVIFQIAADVGIDVERLKTDMEAPEITAYLQMTRSVGDSLGVRGTPAMVIDDMFIGGFIPEDQLKVAIESARAEG